MHTFRGDCIPLLLLLTFKTLFALVTQMTSSSSSEEPLQTLADELISLMTTHLAARDLDAFACTSKKHRALAADERAVRVAERKRLEAIERRERKLAKEKFSAFEGDARLLCTVIRHMILNPDPNYSLHTTTTTSSSKTGRKKLITPPSGVCRLRVGVCANGGVTTDEQQADVMVDVLAMQQAALQRVVFLGAPLGAAGAAVAVRQARALRLAVPNDTTIHGRVFKLFIRADVIRGYIDSSPTLKRLLELDEA